MIKFIQQIFNMPRWYNRGVLYGKTDQQKKDFFNGLMKFYKTDPVFFEEQVNDLKSHELTQFVQHVHKLNEQDRTILSLLSIIDKLSKLETNEQGKG